MRDIRPALRAEARQVADWLEAHADDWAPIRVVRVYSDITEDIDDTWSIQLTMILEDPPDPMQGWPVDELLAMFRAATDYSHTLEHAMFVYVRPATESGPVARALAS